MATIRDVGRYTNGILNAVSSPRVRNWVSEIANVLFHQIVADDDNVPSQEFLVLPSETPLSIAAEELFFNIRVIAGRIRRASVPPLKIRGVEVGDEIADILFVVEELEVGEEIRLAGKRWPAVAALARFDNLGLLITKKGREIVIQKLDPADSIGGSI